MRGFAADARQLSRWLLVLLVALVLVTFRDYGVSWDEHVQNVYGHRLLSYYLSGFTDNSAFHFSNLRYYGGAFDLIAAVLNAVSPFGEYETRHLLGGVIGVVTALGAWRLGRLLAGERAGFLVLALTALTPLLYGHSFINPKDVPFATALLWSIFYFCRAIVEAPAPRVGTVIGLGVALGLALGTRVVAGIALLYCVPALIGYTLGRYLESRNAVIVARELWTFFARLLLGLPMPQCAEVERRVGIWHPEGSNDGSIELIQCSGIRTRDFAERAVAPNVGILSLRLPVGDAATLAAQITARGWPLYTPPMALEIALNIAALGPTITFAVRTPDGAILEFYSPA